MPLFDEKIDVFAPCALGGSINASTIDRIKARIVAGAANNQLKTPDMDLALFNREILYAPDYVINGAGVVSVGLEALGIWTVEEITKRIDRIGDVLSDIFDVSKSEKKPTGAVADEMVMSIINEAKSKASSMEQSA